MGGFVPRAAGILLAAPGQHAMLFMLDDFESRTKHYGIVLKFAVGVEAADRAIVFRRDPNFDAKNAPAASAASSQP
jgi:hypothetical protein